jgi:hypothetical protein
MATVCLDPGQIKATVVSFGTAGAAPAPCGLALEVAMPNLI